MKMSSEMETVVKEIHRSARCNYPCRKYDIGGLDEIFQADLVEMQPYARENKGYRYMITAIDVFPKYTWAVPVKNKTDIEITAGIKSILEQGRVPQNLQPDQRSQFYNKDFENLMKKDNINMYSSYSNLKASIIERFNRTLRGKMWKKFSLQDNHKWINILSSLISSYNNTKHQTIGMKPKDVNPTNKAEVVKRFRYKNISVKNQKFKIGDKVRIS